VAGSNYSKVLIYTLYNSIYTHKCSTIKKMKFKKKLKGRREHTTEKDERPLTCFMC